MTKYPHIMTRYHHKLTKFYHIMTKYHFIMTRYQHIITKYHHKMTKYYHIMTIYPYIMTKYHHIMTQYHHIMKHFIIRQLWRSIRLRSRAKYLHPPLFFLFQSRFVKIWHINLFTIQVQWPPSILLPVISPPSLIATKLSRTDFPPC